MTNHAHIYDDDGDCIVCGDDLFAPVGDGPGELWAHVVPLRPSEPSPGPTTAPVMSTRKKRQREVRKLCRKSAKAWRRKQRKALAEYRTNHNPEAKGEQ